jgi:hypothetical protein
VARGVSTRVGGYEELRTKNEERRTQNAALKPGNES